MASEYKRIMDGRALTANQAQELTTVFDAGAYRELHVDARFPKVGSGGNVKLQHAAVNEEGAYRDIQGATFLSTSAAGSYMRITDFLRYVRWVCDGSIAGNPVGVIDVIAKE